MIGVYGQIQAQNDAKKILTREVKEVKKVKRKKSKEKDPLIKLAEQRTTELQKELNLGNYASYYVKQAIIKYSKEANKVIQSNLSANEKTKSLSNIIYLQDKAFKEVLTVHQFYKYKKMTTIR